MGAEVTKAHHRHRHRRRKVVPTANSATELATLETLTTPLGDTVPVEPPPPTPTETALSQAEENAPFPPEPEVLPTGDNPPDKADLSAEQCPTAENSGDERETTENYSTNPKIINLLADSEHSTTPRGFHRHHHSRRRPPYYGLSEQSMLSIAGEGLMSLILLSIVVVLYFVFLWPLHALRQWWQRRENELLDETGPLPHDRTGY